MTALHMYSILLIVVRGSAVVTMEVPQYPFAKRGCYHRQYIALSTGSNRQSLPLTPGLVSFHLGYITPRRREAHPSSFDGLA
jgi:hypothetical protein